MPTSTLVRRSQTGQAWQIPSGTSIDLTFDRTSIGGRIAIGLVGAPGVTRVLRALLYDISPTDPLTFAGVVPLLAAAALLACWVPARRAMRTDPIVRCE
jgi:hypothetical protein